MVNRASPVALSSRPKDDRVYEGNDILWNVSASNDVSVRRWNVNGDDSVSTFRRRSIEADIRKYLPSVLWDGPCWKLIIERSFYWCWFNFRLSSITESKYFRTECKNTSLGGVKIIKIPIILKLECPQFPQLGDVTSMFRTCARVHKKFKYL